MRLLGTGGRWGLAIGLVDHDVRQTIVHSAAFWPGDFARMPKSKEPSRVFSFKPCCEIWEQSRALRKRALQRKLLVKDANDSNVVHASLPNLRINFRVLKAYTEAMANEGVIVTKYIKYLEEPIQAFYEVMEVDMSTKDATSFVYGTAFVVKCMLTLVKRKWRRWEIPRVARLIFVRSVVHWIRPRVFRVAMCVYPYHVNPAQLKDKLARELVLDLARAYSKAYEAS